MTKRFQEAVDTLANAYLTGNLKAQSCKTCAVGNMLGSEDWQYLFMSGNIDFGRYNRPITPGEKAAAMIIDNSSYDIKELAAIELTFEQTHKEAKKHSLEEEFGPDWKIKANEDFVLWAEFKNWNKYEHEWQFEALMAVVDVLARFDNINLEAVEEAKTMFDKELVEA
jgi:hypothetical protein